MTIAIVEWTYCALRNGAENKQSTIAVTVSLDQLEIGAVGSMGDVGRGRVGAKEEVCVCVCVCER